MKAQDYVDKYLERVKSVTSEDELKKLDYEIFMAFSDEVTEIAKMRNAKKNDAVISIIKEIGKKYDKFCRLMNEQQTVVELREGAFFKEWDSKLQISLYSSIQAQRKTWMRGA